MGGYFGDDGLTLAIACGSGERVLLDPANPDHVALVRFFAEPVKDNVIFFIRRFAARGDCKSVFILLKGIARKVLGKSPGIIPDDFEHLAKGLAGDLRTDHPEALEVGFMGHTFRIRPAKSRGLGIILHALADVRTIVFCNQYNVSELNVRGKVVVDAGANLGIFSLLATSLGAKKIYAFEPLNETYAALVENIELNGLGGKVVAVNKALGAADGGAMVWYSDAGDVGATLLDAAGKTNSQEVKVTSIDSFFSTKKEVPGFIKMDVEGYEENVLEGARETVLRCRPVLSFSAYHKPDDVRHLPMVVSGMHGGYTCKLLKRGDPVFYCECPGADKV